MSGNVLILATGGTIASTGAEGATPDLTGERLVNEVPLLDERAEVEQVAQRPSPDMDFETLQEIKQRIETFASESHDGVIITHGTDTMAQSAYYLDLQVSQRTPVIFTGAQRRPDQPGADGPANLNDAVAVVQSVQAQSAPGVVICMNGEIHHARQAVKSHSWRPDTFSSPDTGAAGAVTPAGVEWYDSPQTETPDLSVDTPPQRDVPIITTGINMSTDSVERAVNAGCDGLVVEATGLGNTSERVADALKDAIDSDVPVVITTRCHQGGVAPVYGGGGGHTLASYGAVFAGRLPATKARLKLILSLENGYSIAETFSGDSD